MQRLSILKHKKQFSNAFDVVELLFDDCTFYVRVKFSHMSDSKVYIYRESYKARFEYTKLCMFILS